MIFDIIKLIIKITKKLVKQKKKNFMSNLYNLFTNIRTGYSNVLSLFCAVLISGLFCAPSLFAQSPVITKETMGTVAATTAITAHETANGFINTALTMTNGGAAASADIRATSVSTTAPTYTGASGSANLFFSGKRDPPMRRITLASTIWTPITKMYAPPS